MKLIASWFTSTEYGSLFVKQANWNEVFIYYIYIFSHQFDLNLIWEK